MFPKLLVVALCMLFPIAVIAGAPGKLREIDSKDLKVDFEKGRWNKPKTITSVDELDKAIPDADTVKKQIDFSKDKIVLFAWGGSGGDKLIGKLSDDAKTATFTYQGGLTRDFRRHVHLFVLPKTAEIKLIGAK